MSDKLNLLNLPSRSPQQRELRRCLRAPDGHRLIVVDSAQIEVRVLAWAAGNKPVLSAIREGRDLHSEFATAIYGPGDWHKGTRERQVAKSARLALQFGQGAGGLCGYCQRSGIPLDPREAEQIVALYRRSNPSELLHWDRLHVESLHGSITLPSGRRLLYADVRRENGSYTYAVPAVFSRSRGEERATLWRGQAANHHTQATARDVVMWQSLLACRASPYARVAHTVYDELVLVAPTARADECLAATLEAFRTAPPWAAGLPLDAEGHVAEHYGK